MVGAVLIGSIIDFTQGAWWAAAAALSAVVVLFGLAIGAAALTQRQRDRALDLIIEGRENVAVAAVQRERQRLHAPGTQRHLARAIDGMIELALNPPKIRGRGARPLFEIAVVACVAEDLRAISRRLGAQHASVRGVALAERLMSDGTSPLYRDQADVLREQPAHLRSDDRLIALMSHTTRGKGRRAVGAGLGATVPANPTRRRQGVAWDVSDRWGAIAAREPCGRRVDGHDAIVTRRQSQTPAPDAHARSR